MIRTIDKSKSKIKNKKQTRTTGIGSRRGSKNHTLMVKGDGGVRKGGATDIMVTDTRLLRWREECPLMHSVVTSRLDAMQIYPDYSVYRDDIDFANAIGAAQFDDVSNLVPSIIRDASEVDGQLMHPFTETETQDTVDAKGTTEFEQKDNDIEGFEML